MATDELESVVRQSAEETLTEVGDPDEGLELRESVRQQLQRTIAPVRLGLPPFPPERLLPNWA